MNTNAQQLTRRKFLQHAAVATVAAPWIIPASARGANGAVPPSERVTIGLIGRGCMGRGHLHVLLGRRDAQVLAVCDVDRERREEGKRLTEETYAAERASGVYRGCAALNDYRELLARSDIDAVVIATPDHWHTPISVQAAEAGKDVYCEKPVSVTIREGRQLVETVRQFSRVFQTGTQYRSIPRIRQVCEFVRAGGLGRVKAAFTIWGQYQIPAFGPSYVPLDPALPAEPTPEGLDWNLWVGPATWRPYNHHYHRNPIPGVVPWVFSEAFGVVAATGYQSHAADVIQYALGMETSGPVEVFHPSSGEFPTLTFRYANGTLLHHVDHWGMVKDVYKAVPVTARLAGNFGGLFVGERGWLTSMSTGGLLEGEPESLFDEMKLQSRDDDLSNNHHSNWFNCVRSRALPSSHEEIGHRSASLGHLAIIAYKLGRSLKWDPAKEKFAGDEQANRLCSRAQRASWAL